MKKSVVIVVLGLALIFAFTGCTAQSENTDSAELVEAQNEINELKENLRKLESEKAILQSEYDAWKAATQDWIDMKEDEKAAEKEKAKKKGDLSKLSQEISDKEKELSEVQAQIDAAKGELIKALGEPMSFPAGYLYAGKDFPAGRYKVYDGTSNFIVHNKNGHLRVNIILTTEDDPYDVKEYVYTFEDGDEIKASSAFKLIAIE